MIIIYFLFLCSFLLFLVSIITNVKTHKYEGRADGKIVDIKETCRSGRNNKIYIYYPIYQYMVEGIIYEEEFPFGDKSPHNLPIGEEAIIKYDKKNPEKFIVTGKEYVWLGQALFGLFMSMIMLAIIIGKYLGL